MRLEWRDRATRLAVVTALVNGSVFALVAGWRTFVHAKRWLTDHDRSWRAVFEARAWGSFTCCCISATAL
jgi:hypothetical protein